MLTSGYDYALIVQLLLLLSVYIIYFQSTILTDLKPQPILLKHPPADRLVVFLASGLSAKTFFEQRCRNVPELQKIFQQPAQVGIVRAKTAIRGKSAHVTLFAGYYEDAMAAVHGAAFDTIFNRSTCNYVWGSPELLKQFPNIYKGMALPSDVLSLAEESYKLDEWTFNAVQRFLKIKASYLQQLNSLMFVIQLPGLQESIGMKMFYKNLNYIQQGIWYTYQRFEHTFPDQRTAYLLISEYGLPIWGHPANDSKQELETPWMMWGTGVSNSNSSPGRTFVANEQKQRLPLHILEPTQLTTLMSGLLGLPPPLHNRGQLPVGLIESGSYEAHAMLANGLQLLEQALLLQQHHRRGFLSSLMPSFSKTRKQLYEFLHKGNLLWQQRRYITLTEYCVDFMHILMQCIEYYTNYYRRILLVASACAYLGWLHQLRCLSGPAGTTSSRHLALAKAVLRLLILIVFAFVLLQRLTWLNSALLLLPGLIWTQALRLHEACEHLLSCRQLRWPILLSCCCIAGFFDRRYIACCYFGFSCLNNRWALIQRRSLDSYIWLLLVCCLTSICWLPPSLGYWQRSLLLASLTLTFVGPIAYRPMHFSCALHRQNLLCNGFVLLAASLHTLYSTQLWLHQLIARGYMCYVFYPRSRQQGRELFVYNLCTLYALLSTSYESLVIQLLVMELQLALRLRQNNEMQLNQTQLLAMYMLIYSFYSFFVIGDVAAVSTYSILMGINGFGYYSTFINGLLIALKLLLPLLILMCIMCGNCEITRIHKREVFHMLLIMCNIIALVFLFRVRVDGSWWEIKVRVILFIIVQVIPFILLLLCHIADLMLNDSTKHLIAMPKWDSHIF